MVDKDYTTGSHPYSEILDIILAFSCEVERDKLLDMLLTQMMNLTNSDAGTLYTIKDVSLNFSIVKNKSLDISKSMEDVIDWPAIPLDETNINNISAYAAVKREVALITDVYDDDSFNFTGAKTYDARIGYRTQSMLVLPLIGYDAGKSVLLGVIQLINAIDHDTGRVTSHSKTSNIPLLTALSCIAASTLLTMQYAQEIEALNEITLKDALTEIGNRRYTDKILSQEWNLSFQKQQPVSFLIIDIDHFKFVNDNYGHVSGDMVLKKFAVILRRALRTTDYISRWGGEEFAVILSDIDSTGARVVAEKIRLIMEKAEFETVDGETIKITVSVGVHTNIVTHDSCYSLTNFIADTDDALYEAKRAGRNRISQVEPKKK